MDDKTTKIPSLKEFQESQAKYDNRRRQKMKKSNAKKSVNNKSTNADTHKVDIKDKRKTSSYPASTKTKEYSRVSKPVNRPAGSVSGATRKIDSAEVRSRADIKSSSYETHRTSGVVRNSSSSSGLTQKRAAGQRPVRKDTQQRVVHEQRQRPTGQKQVSQRPYPPKSDAHKSAVSSGRNVPRKQKKRKKPLSPFARKIRTIMVYILIVLAILAAGVILSLTVLFKTENISVNIPEGVYTSQEIISASGLRYEENIFTANKAKAEKQLMEKLPYIKTAEVKASIPDTIKINIVLSDPAYAVKGDKLTYIANEDSKVLEVVATADEVDVPIIEGVSVNNAKVGETLEYNSDIVKSTLSEMFNFAILKGYKNITRVDIDSQTTSSGTETVDLKYVYDDRIVVYMGIPENITYKMETAQKIISEKLDVNNTVLTGELDVSMCYETKRSYFNQYTLIPDIVVTEPSTEATSTVAEEY